MAATSNLAGFLERSAARFPDRVAVVDPAGWSLTYRELDDRASRVASFLVSRGVRPGDRVGLLVPKGADAATVLFGIMKARAAYVPADYTAPIERNRTIVSDCGVRAAFIDPRCVPVFTSGWTAGSLPSAVVVLDPEGIGHDAAGIPLIPWGEVLAHPTGPPVEGRTEQDVAYILYTSGSTGIPKGVILSHRNAVSFVDWCSQVFSPTEDDRLSNHAPFHFDLSVLDIYLAIKHASALYIVSEDLGKNPKELGRFIAENRLTIWYSTPSILTLLYQFGDLSSLDLSPLRIVLFAGEVFPVKHLREVTRLIPHAVYYNLYGPTETNVCTYARIPLPVPEDRTTPYPIGWPCSHCDDVVLDPNERTELPRGEEGLLYIAGPSVFEGYWNRPVENASAFLERDGRRWYNTGDVVRLDPEDGYIYLGRKDRMVKRRGYRIELGEIERALYQHPKLREVAVVAVSDEAGVRIVGFLTAQADPRPSIIELKTYCGQNLPAYMSPDVFQFVDALPRTSTNKVDYQSLARRLQQAAPSTGAR